MKYLLIFLFCSINYGQGIVNNPFVVFPTSGDDAIMTLSPLLYLTPASIDPDVTVDGNALTSPFWEDTSGNGYDATTGGGSFVLNIGTTGRQVEWTASGWMDIVDTAALDFTPGTDEITLVWRYGDAVNPTGSGYPISKAGGTTAVRTGAYYGAAATYSAVLVGGTASYPSPSTVVVNGLVVLRISTTSVDMWIDGTQVVTGGGVGTGVSSGQSWNIGGRTDGGYVVGSGFMMDMIALIPSAISTAEREAIEAEFQTN